MASTLDDLMDKDPLQLTKEDITAIVDYQRKARQNWEAGVKPKKEAGPKPSVSLADMMKGRLTPKPDAPKIVRRV